MTGSTDAGTLRVLAEADAARLTVVRAPRNGGPARARNRGLAAATGDWIGFTDADDLWRPGHAGVLAAALAADAAAVWAAGNHAVWGLGGAVPSQPLTSAIAGEAVSPGLVRMAGPALTRALAGNYWLHLGGCFVRADVLRGLGGFASAATFSEDWLLALRLSTVGPLYYRESAGYWLRRQGGSLTTSSRRFTAERLSGKRLAMRDPALAPFRRELRWALLGTRKELAANNLLLGRPARAARFAVGAWLMDPREVGDLARFAGMVLGGDRAGLRRYTTAELVGTGGAGGGSVGDKGGIMAQQPHTEADIVHTDDDQNTGNHKVPGAPAAGGADRVGGTRTGAENVEPEEKSPS